MEFDDDNDTNNNAMWEWQGDEFNLQIDTRNELSHLFWDKLSQSEDDLWYTPIKDCADFGHSSLSDLRGEAATKTLEGGRDSLQPKRRRMLQFTSDTSESPSEQTKVTVMEDEVVESLECTAQWTSVFSEDSSGLNFEGLDQPSDGWLVDCLNDSEIKCSPDEMNTVVAFNQQADISAFHLSIEYYQDLPAMQETPAPINLEDLKDTHGKKSGIRSPRKLTTSVAYPFALIKPCGVHGDLTLSDINRRIHAPPPSKSKHEKTDLYPTSAFSGKPVVVKTKIRTEGGQGSITIMRTKG
ncbi:protein XRI1-like isoform X3 [Zingiber officinale]|uniref:protein XRI1-like isoform X3 n=1 Tax=Zingiber officinale TaxID=94328 RepID=UPI001C4D4FB7|nr:protein XRI1-like isoform X3 [Zingiber officinale]